ncbi:hypothetical protein PPACK8108_LOCUS20252 [Phakopsora pachyrhizi]|uniref:Uncharacterized protein n=1 Tax=Phakopsora pachyrhizi TaxID=170000 RepID=A0AAV0BEK2_PHAPC|nr:hypothetical protein PPACK8108_LOCUS20252 [Phakopsora pachyrhizi]
MKKNYLINHNWNIQSLKFVCFILILDFVQSLNSLNYIDVALTPQLGQAPLDIRSPVGSLSEHSKLIRPPASFSYATKPNFEPIYPQQSADFQSWQSLVQHKGNHNEDLLAHQNEATRLEKTHNFDFELLSEHLQLAYPSASGSSATTPNLEPIYPQQSADFQSWQNLVQHHDAHNVDLFAHQNEAIRLEKTHNFDVNLVPQRNQAPPDIILPFGSLSEHSQLLYPSASGSSAITPNLEHIYTQQPVNSHSWQNLVQHKDNPNEDLFEDFFTHQNEAIWLEKAHNFGVNLAPRLSQAPTDLKSSFFSLSEHSQLPYPSASGSSAITPNFEPIYTQKPADISSWDNSAQHQRRHNANIDKNYQSSLISSNDYNYLSQNQNLNGENLLNIFLDGENSSKRTKITNTGAYLPSYQNSKNQNQNWSFETLVDFDFTDAQFNSMIDAYLQAPMPHEENLNEEKIFGSPFDKDNLRRETIERFNEKNMPSHLTGEKDYPQKSLFYSSINMEDSECSKPQESEQPLKYKRKYHIYELKSAGAREPNSDVAEVYGAEEGSIDKKFRLKSQLDGLVDTSNANLELDDEEIKMKLDEPEKSYKLLKYNNGKSLKENETLNHDPQIYLYQPRAAWENVRNEAENNVPETEYSINVNSEYPSIRLKAVVDVLYKQLKLQEHNELTSLDNFIEGIYKRAKYKFHPDYILGNLIDWNVKKKFEERVNYFLECDGKLRKISKKQKGVETSDGNDLNKINRAIFKEVSRKFKSFWRSYNENFRHSYLPSNKRTSKHAYESLIKEIGVSRGLNHLEKLNLGKYINQALEKISLNLQIWSKSRKKTDPIESKYQMAKNTIIIITNYIVILYRIFTPFDNKTIEEMRTNLALVIEHMIDFWMYFFAATYNKRFSSNTHKNNPFIKKNIINQLLNQFSSKTIHFKRDTITASRRFFWNWISDSDGINFQLIYDSSNQTFMPFFLNFIDDCAIVDFLESTTSSHTNLIAL